MSASELLGVQDLSVHVDGRALLRGVSFALRPGESLTLLGESGAGKSLLAQAVMGQLPPGLRAGGEVRVGGRASRAGDAHARRALWGRSLALLPQEPALALDPLLRVGSQVARVHRVVGRMGEGPALERAAAELDGAGLGGAGDRHAWQLSGGMAQRAAALIARAGGPPVLLADEPTKGLDAHWRDRTIALMQSVQREGGCVVVITHDLRVARAMGGRLIVLQAGDVVEQGEAGAVLDAQGHAFTRALVAASPERWPRRAAPTPGAELLQAQGVGKSFGGRALFAGIGLRIAAGERWVLQGPSGCGKSTLGNLLLGLLPPDSGTLRRAPHLPATAFQKLYQDPAGSFAPTLSLGQSLRHAARRHGMPWAGLAQRLARLGIEPALLARRPAQVSGGELQRIALARALAARPALLVADEPTSRLDLVTQRAAIDELLGAVDEAGAALVLVTHDDAMAASVGQRRVEWRDDGASVR